MAVHGASSTLLIARPFLNGRAYGVCAKRGIKWRHAQTRTLKNDFTSRLRLSLEMSHFGLRR